MTVLIRPTATEALDEAATAAIWEICQAAFRRGTFGTDDLAHAMGGRHFLAEADGRLVAHASVVPRVLEVAGLPIQTGYVEAVATDPAWQSQGIATRLMMTAADHIRAKYELGALSTGRRGFYERLGWRVWAGPTWMRTPDGPVSTADEHGGILWLPTPRTPPITGEEPISCEWRPGDAW